MLAVQRLAYNNQHIIQNQKGSRHHAAAPCARPQGIMQLGTLPGSIALATHRVPFCQYRNGNIAGSMAPGNQSRSSAWRQLTLSPRCHQPYHLPTVLQPMQLPKTQRMKQNSAMCCETTACPTSLSARRSAPHIPLLPEPSPSSAQATSISRTPHAALLGYATQPAIANPPSSWVPRPWHTCVNRICGAHSSVQCHAMQSVNNSVPLHSRRLARQPQTTLWLTTCWSQQTRCCRGPSTECNCLGATAWCPGMALETTPRLQSSPRWETSRGAWASRGPACACAGPRLRVRQQVQRQHRPIAWGLEQR